MIMMMRTTEGIFLVLVAVSPEEFADSAMNYQRSEEILFLRSFSTAHSRRMFTDVSSLLLVGVTGSPMTSPRRVKAFSGTMHQCASIRGRQLWFSHWLSLSLSLSLSFYLALTLLHNTSTRCDVLFNRMAS